MFDDIDWVRTEIERALGRGIPVIPLLIHPTPMPTEDRLPSSIARFSSYQAASLDAGVDFPHHISRLISKIAQLVGGEVTQPEQEIFKREVAIDVPAKITMKGALPRRSISTLSELLEIAGSAERIKTLTVSVIYRYTGPVQPVPNADTAYIALNQHGASSLGKTFSIIEDLSACTKSSTVVLRSSGPNKGYSLDVAIPETSELLIDEVLATMLFESRTTSRWTTH